MGHGKGQERKNLEGILDCVSGAGEKDTMYLVGRELDSLYILNFWGKYTLTPELSIHLHF
jgi:hypothetical protein